MSQKAFHPFQELLLESKQIEMVIDLPTGRIRNNLSLNLKQGKDHICDDLSSDFTFHFFLQYQHVVEFDSRNS